MNILIIEDNLYLAKQIQDTFKNYDFSNRVEMITSYNHFLTSYNSLTSFDIILLDINLGDSGNKDGFDILEYIRGKNEKIPVIVISSHGEYSFLEKAFQKGAHDYIIKPFRSRELQIRVQRWFRNYIFSEYFCIRKTLEYENIEYDITAYKFFYKGEKILLSKGNKYLLSLFIIHRETLITHKFFIEKIWGYSDEDYQKNLRIKILRLKKQLTLFGLDKWILTERGEGYIFQKPISIH